MARTEFNVDAGIAQKRRWPGASHSSGARIVATATKVIKLLLPAAFAGSALFSSATCLAATTIDAQGDFLATYIGVVGPDLDILQFTVSMDAANFTFEILLNGAIGTTAMARYNIGVNRGSGTNQFGEDFRPGTTFDTTINLVPFGPTGEVRNFGTTTVITPLNASAITVSGNSLSAIVPISMLPSSGYDPQNYTFLLWSRTPVGPVTRLGIADFAPDNGAISAVPEPGTWLLMLFGFAAVGLAARRRRMSAFHPFRTLAA
jgi:hypothetical protein